MNLVWRRYLTKKFLLQHLLGCGATTGLAPRIAQTLGIPVLDPGLTAVKYAEMLVDLGLSHSKRAYPYNPRVMQLLTGMAAGRL